MTFLARSVRVLDAEVIDDAVEIVTSLFSRIGGGGDNAAEAGAPNGPTRADRVRTGVVVALLVVLAIVVVSTVVLS